ncbi:hypothetical protein [Bradyrhizobium genosp. A]|uniref:hypothetical protein n=1 Tax=Bradyrhizobium genosp. A TaxID=83626 RepID=UPI003CFBB47C
MRPVVLFLCAFAIAFAPAAINAATGRCVLQVARKTYLDEQCEIAINDDQGSFSIGVGERHRSKYFAYVNIDSDGARGYWNETSGSNHAHTSLGKLKRNGACWENKTARVCAYR